MITDFFTTCTPNGKKLSNFANSESSLDCDEVITRSKDPDPSESELI